MDKHLPSLAQSLNRGKTGTLRLRAGSVRISLGEGRDPVFGKFNIFEIRWPGSKRPQKSRCFLGHRFTKTISESLRLNLRYILEPSNISLVWSGMDMNAAGFFDDIVRKIRKCHFCIFDNRSTERKPNVYIEAGIAYVLKKPFILANYRGNRVGVPTDLIHILNIPYDDYRDLTKQIYFNLPVFLRDTGLLRKRRKVK